MKGVFSEIINEFKIDDTKTNESIKQYENNIKQERFYFLKQTTPQIFQTANIENIDKRIKDFILSNKIFCWIYGDFGRGKSYSIYAVRNYFIIQKGNIYFDIKMEGELNYDIDFKKINAIDNLAISESKMKYLADYYFNLIDWCWKNKKKLYLTSTKKFDEWLSFFSKYNNESAQAIASRFSNNLEYIELLGQDRRKIK